jgi:hypothetical protein
LVFHFVLGQWEGDANLVFYYVLRQWEGDANLVFYSVLLHFSQDEFQHDECRQHWVGAIGMSSLSPRLSAWNLSSVICHNSGGAAIDAVPPNVVPRQVILNWRAEGRLARGNAPEHFTVYIENSGLGNICNVPRLQLTAFSALEQDTQAIAPPANFASLSREIKQMFEGITDSDATCITDIALGCVENGPQTFVPIWQRMWALFESLGIGTVVPVPNAGLVNSVVHLYAPTMFPAPAINQWAAMTEDLLYSVNGGGPTFALFDLSLYGNLDSDIMAIFTVLTLPFLGTPIIPRAGWGLSRAGTAGCFSERLALHFTHSHHPGYAPPAALTLAMWVKAARFLSAFAGGPDGSSIWQGLADIASAVRFASPYQTQLPGPPSARWYKLPDNVLARLSLLWAAARRYRTGVTPARVAGDLNSLAAPPVPGAAAAPLAPDPAPAALVWAPTTPPPFGPVPVGFEGLEGAWMAAHDCQTEATFLELWSTAEQRELIVRLILLDLGPLFGVAAGICRIDCEEWNWGDSFKAPDAVNACGTEGTICTRLTSGLMTLKTFLVDSTPAKARLQIAWPTTYGKGLVMIYMVSAAIRCHADKLISITQMCRQTVEEHFGVYNFNNASVDDAFSRQDANPPPILKAHDMYVRTVTAGALSLGMALGEREGAMDIKFRMQVQMMPDDLVMAIAFGPCIHQAFLGDDSVLMGVYNPTPQLVDAVFALLAPWHNPALAVFRMEYKLELLTLALASLGYRPVYYTCTAIKDSFYGSTVVADNDTSAWVAANRPSDDHPYNTSILNTGAGFVRTAEMGVRRLAGIVCAPCTGESLVQTEFLRIGAIVPAAGQARIIVPLFAALPNVLTTNAANMNIYAARIAPRIVLPFVAGAAVASNGEAEAVTCFKALTAYCSTKVAAIVFSYCTIKVPSVPTGAVLSGDLCLIANSWWSQMNDVAPALNGSPATNAPGSFFAA